MPKRRRRKKRIKRRASLVHNRHPRSFFCSLERIHFQKNSKFFSLIIDQQYVNVYEVKPFSLYSTNGTIDKKWEVQQCLVLFTLLTDFQVRLFLLLILRLCCPDYWHSTQNLWFMPNTFFDFFFIKKVSFYDVLKVLNSRMLWKVWKVFLL